MSVPLSAEINPDKTFVVMHTISKHSTANHAPVVLKQLLYMALAIGCLLPWASAPMALLAGLVVGIFVGTPFRSFNKKASTYLLQASVVGLGFGMNAADSIKAGSDGMLFTLVSVVGVMLTGIVAGKWLGLRTVPAYLIEADTAN